MVINHESWQDWQGVTRRIPTCFERFRLSISPLAWGFVDHSDDCRGFFAFSRLPLPRVLR